MEMGISRRSGFFAGAELVATFNDLGAFGLWDRVRTLDWMRPLGQGFLEFILAGATSIVVGHQQRAGTRDFRQ